MKLKAIIPAAGLGTRMLPATKSIPKEMLPVYDKPAISYIVDEAIEAGITDILIITARGKDAVENYFDKSYELEDRLAKDNKEDLLKVVQSCYGRANISFVRQTEPKGLGDAVLSAKSFVGDCPFAVLYGDDIIVGEKPAIGEMAEIFYKTQSPVLGIKKVPHNSISRYGCVEYENTPKGMKILSMVEKPAVEKAPSDYAILGRVILTPDIFPILETQPKGKNNELQLTDAMASLLTKKDFYGCCYSGTHYDTGNKVQFLRASIIAGLNSQDKESVKEMLLTICSDLK